jgi:hypothetical protein
MIGAIVFMLVVWATVSYCGLERSERWVWDDRLWRWGMNLVIAFFCVIAIVGAYRCATEGRLPHSGWPTMEFHNGQSG